jgi:hypothetical protein
MHRSSEPVPARARPTGRTFLRLAAVAAALAVAAPTPARADGWTRIDTALELGLVGLSVTDFAQTSWFLSHRPLAYETNPLLGRHPSRARIATFGAVALSSHAIVARLLPQPYRRLWQLAAIGMEVDAVTSNAMTFGVHLSF